ncbi:hypothetical protein HanRHA438_Chr00c17g0851411 [Helianthus annuus]|nr:hypothetical protein HanRHA438_Chr00c17g0851411 [Helianthus annuus]
MDADTALELVKKGAALLFLDVPQHTLFGIDTQFAVHHTYQCSSAPRYSLRNWAVMIILD